MIMAALSLAGALSSMFLTRGPRSNFAQGVQETTTILQGPCLPLPLSAPNEWPHTTPQHTKFTQNLTFARPTMSEKMHATQSRAAAPVLQPGARARSPLSRKALHVSCGVCLVFSNCLNGCGGFLVGYFLLPKTEEKRRTQIQRTQGQRRTLKTVDERSEGDRSETEGRAALMVVDHVVARSMTWPSWVALGFLAPRRSTGRGAEFWARSGNECRREV